MSYLVPNIAIALLLFANSAFSLELNSSDTKATVIELYTSEGCSSCPPADEWLSTLKDDSRLFKQIIPMAFHVDYWDELGWKDPWSKPKFTERQRKQSLSATTPAAFVGLFSQIYTPAFLVEGQEWPKWYSYKKLPMIPPVKAGILTAKLDGQTLTVNFSEKGDYELNVAYLGMGLVSNVTAGENRSRKLKHDFVVLNLFQKKGDSSWQLTIPAVPKEGQKETAISIWVTKPDSIHIEQAVAAYIE